MDKQALAIKLEQQGEEIIDFLTCESFKTKHTQLISRRKKVDFDKPYIAFSDKYIIVFQSSILGVKELYRISYLDMSKLSVTTNHLLIITFIASKMSIFNRRDTWSCNLASYRTNFKNQ